MDALGLLIVLGAVNCAITTIITESDLFESLRFHAGDRSAPLGQLLSCPMCCGTWVGAAIAVPAVYEMGEGWDMDGLLLGMVVAFGSLTVGLILRRLIDLGD